MQPGDENVTNVPGVLSRYVYFRGVRLGDHSLFKAN